jgi:hypothetical protein
MESTGPAIVDGSGVTLGSEIARRPRVDIDPASVAIDAT